MGGVDGAFRARCVSVQGQRLPIPMRCAFRELTGLSCSGVHAIWRRARMGLEQGRICSLCRCHRRTYPAGYAVASMA